MLYLWKFKAFSFSTGPIAQGLEHWSCKSGVMSSYLAGPDEQFSYSLGFLVAQMVKNLSAMRETWVQSLLRKIPWRRAWQPTPVFLPGESPWTEKPGELYHTWGCKESDMTEQLSTFSTRIKCFLFCEQTIWYRHHCGPR